MTNQMKNVPELRFPEFDGEWEEGTIKSLVHGNLSDGDWINKEYLLPNGKYRIIQTGNISVGKYLNKEKSSKFISQSSYDELKANEVFPGDILISRLADPAGRSIIMPNINWKMVTSVDVAIIRPNKKFESYFLISILNTDKKLYDISKLVSGTSHKRISRKNLEKVKIIYPKIQEQQKIGDFFSKLDRQIELEEQKLEKLEEQKKGYMQKIFSQELRFKDENGNDYPEWEDKLISDIGKVVTGNTPSKKDNDYWNSNQYVWVTPTDISNKKNIYTSGYQLSQKGFSKARQLPKNTLLITCIASIGKNAILRIEGSCNQQINAVIPNDNYDVDYLYYAFEDVSKLMKSIAGKTATQIVNKAVFEKLLLNVPIYEEQQKISGFLNKVDILIDKQTQKIDELKLRKQGFLQKMFV